MAEPRLSPLKRRIAGTFGARVAMMGLGFVTTVVVARALGPAGRGAYAVAAAVGAIGAQFGHLGLHASNTYEAARDRARLPQLLANSLVVALCAVVLAAVTGLLLPWVLPDAGSLSGPLLWLAVAWIPAGLLFILLQSLSLGLQRIREYNTADLAVQALGLAALVALLAAGQVTVETAFACTLGGMAAGCLISLRRLTRICEGPVRPSRALFRATLAYGGKAYLAALFSFLVLRFDLVLLDTLHSADEAGLYSVAVALGNLVLMLPTVIGTILFPALASITDPAERWAKARRATVMTTGLAALSCAVAAAGGWLAVRVLFGTEYLGALPAFYWLLPGVLVLSVNTVLMNYFAACGMPWITIAAPLAAVALNVALNVWWIPSHGGVGAAWASSIAYGLMLAASVAFVAVAGDRLRGE